MKVKNLFFFSVLNSLLFFVISLNDSIRDLINKKINIQNAKELNDIIDIDFLKESENPFNSIKEETNEFQNPNDAPLDALRQKNLSDRKLVPSRLINSTFLSKISPEDLNNLTRRFSCFYFNEDDFSVFDLSQMDKDEY